MKDLNLDIDLTKIAEEHARYLKPIFPNLKNGLENFSDIIDTERKRFEDTRSKGRRIVESILEKKEKLTDQKMISLYESNGISPEMIAQIASEKKLKTDIPEDFYSKISEKHMTTKVEKEQDYVDTSGIPDTEPLYREHRWIKKFKARVLKVIEKNKIILDKTAFYPESGGQEYDTGTLGKANVCNVQKFGNVVVHYVDSTKLKE